MSRQEVPAKASRRLRKAEGVFYTPPGVVGYMLKHALQPLLDQNAAPTIFDPACGAGAFLCESLRMLLRRTELDPVAAARQSIFGVDVDAGAVELATRRLAAVICCAKPTLSTAAVMAALSKNILVRDSLIDCPETSGLSLDWPASFPQVQSAGGFDLLVTNPPYVNIRLLTQAYGSVAKAHLAQRYLSARGSFDLYALFVERSFDFVRPGGVCCMILPNSIATMEYGTYCRRLLRTEATLLRLTNLESISVFRDAAVYPHILIWRKQRPRHRHSVILERISESSHFTHGGTTATRRQADMIHDSGIRVGKQLDLELRVPTQPLGNLARLDCGCAGFRAQRVAEALLDIEGPLPKDTRDFIVSGNIDPYRIRTGNVRFMRRHFHRPVLPNASDAQTSQKQKLYREPKIVLAGLAKRIEAAYDREGLALGVQVHAASECQLDPYYLVAILNSPLMTQLFCERFQATRLSGNYLSINKSQLAQLPIRLCDEQDADYQRLIELSRQRHAATSPALQRDLEVRINRIVANLYAVDPSDLPATAKPDRVAK